ncbi:MAG: hypothetical protein A3B90_02175 [Candidatus Magasanikbacteria bacterium RIFCSPHIGHO2_02_FULL_41_13]|uniref:Polymerase nucleotidyl transferase domain-containing protein n=1 Tax=Candidatus Magasanikbacteria bacterium RIFCSPHIGHO2_02_FULL_41_13 TaxID=1798676 RepID=A0A1F6M667_9BACT|nr:MAG: hypothetical protein A3B90_02175 [Candidatus Magasanikbacteria bacterium RIFCSPHIGHO2_02_FULL_41_13]
MGNTLAQSVLKTLAFFDIFDYPLTREELWRFLWQAPEIQYSDFVIQVEEILQNELATTVESLGGYYFFPGRSELIAKRERKVSYTEEKIKIACRAARKLRYIPFIEAMFVCNLLPVVVKASSDIDVLIIAKENRIWFTRFLSTLVLTLFRLRPTNFGFSFFSANKKKSMTDKICLSFYLTEKHLDLSNICIEGIDVYQAYWNINLVPLYEREDLHTQFQKKNRWVEKYVSPANTSVRLLPRWKVHDTWLSYGVKSFFAWLFSTSFFEKLVRTVQLKHLNQKERIEEVAIQKSIVISDTMLKFHENDRKKYFQNEWEKRFS